MVGSRGLEPLAHACNAPRLKWGPQASIFRIFSLGGEEPVRNGYSGKAPFLVGGVPGRKGLPVGEDPAGFPRRRPLARPDPYHHQLVIPCALEIVEGPFGQQDPVPPVHHGGSIIFVVEGRLAFKDYKGVLFVRVSVQCVLTSLSINLHVEP